SMARLWRDQGKRDEARELLAPVYGWVTEGVDTRDLKEAKALLEGLAEKCLRRLLDLFHLFVDAGNDHKLYRTPSAVCVIAKPPAFRGEMAPFPDESDFRK